jgi:antagonist of KipI
MGIQVIKQGIADSLQDLGRKGYQHLGINPGGVMDEVACRVAGMLVGNDPAEAVVELHFPAGTFLFQEETLIALSGADFGARINQTEIPINTPIWVGKNSVLSFKEPVRGEWCYLAVRGGFSIPKWLGSYSTHLRAKAGGYNGRYLKRQDEIPLPSQGLHLSSPGLHSSRLGNLDCKALPWKADVRDLYMPEGKIRVLEGREFKWLNAPSRQLLLSLPFTVTLKSDRMGYRLKGPFMQATTVRQLISTGLTGGTVQLLPSGELIVLMADHQATGGYPRVAHVISVDIPRLAQTSLHSPVHFSLSSRGEAEDLLIEREQYLEQLRKACLNRLQKYLDKYVLH